MYYVYHEFEGKIISILTNIVINGRLNQVYDTLNQIFSKNYQ